MEGKKIKMECMGHCELKKPFSDIVKIDSVENFNNINKYRNKESNYCKINYKNEKKEIKYVLQEKKKTKYEIWHFDIDFNEPSACEFLKQWDGKCNVRTRKITDQGSENTISKNSSRKH